MAADLRVMHLICSDGFSGAERHIVRLAATQAAAGLSPIVIGGDERAMTDGLRDTGVEWLPGSGVQEVARSAAAMPDADILHTHMTASDVAGVLSSIRRSRPVVSTRHFAARRGSSVPARIAMAAIAPRIAAQIAISKFVADAIEGRSTVVYAGVEADRSDEVARQPEILVAQRLQPEKQTALIIDAWARLRPSGWRLTILGRGPERAQLEELVALHGLADSVSFEGFTPQIRDRLKSAAVVVATAPQEPYGLTVVEAMASGTPVLAAAAAGHLETVGRVGTTGLFTPDDPDSLVDRLSLMMSDEVERASYGARLREYQQTHLTLARQHEETLKVYEGVLA
jgi:glycosyltransferase involved in cell wall biosynthesis